ncbi:MAG: hypothetical protein SEPTF4163_003251 [Sporothrix epigloea]
MDADSQMPDFDNSGRGPLRVPGFSGISINYELPVEARFAHGFNEWRSTFVVTAQELAMVAVMDRLTDKPNWFIDVFDDAVVAQWRAELERDRFILNPRLMQGKTWPWCVQELRDKAVYFKEHHHIRVLDTGSCVCKADSTELQNLGAIFRSAVEPLADQHKYDKEQMMRKIQRERVAENQMSEPGQDADAGPASAQAGDDTVEGEPAPDDESSSAAHNEQAANIMTDTQSVVGTSQSIQDEHAAGNNNSSSHFNTQQRRFEDGALALGVDDLTHLFDDAALDDAASDYAASDHAASIFGWRWDWQGQDNSPTIDESAYMISTLLDLRLFPLCYGRTMILQHGVTVKLEDMWASYNSAQAALSQKPELSRDSYYPVLAGQKDKVSRNWSLRYQSLPCEAEFILGGPTDCGVKITSYINGLHPNNTELYGAIERVLSCCIKPWNDCLVRGRDGMHDEKNLGQLGPIAARIVTYGVEWENELPEWATEFRVPTARRRRSYHEQLRKHPRNKAKVDQMYRDVVGKEHLKLPPRDSTLWDLAREYLLKPEPRQSSGTAHAEPVPLPDAWEIGDERTWELLCEKAERVVCYKHPEPGTAFLYDDWKLGRHDSRPIVGKSAPRLVTRNGARPRTPPVTPPHVPYTVALQDTFRDRGLQVLVEISSIELNPETPAYGPHRAAWTEAHRAWAAKKIAKKVSKNMCVKLSAKADEDGWRLAGQLNEHIAAVAIFAFDTENVTEPRVAFRQKLNADDRLYRYDECFQFPDNVPGCNFPYVDDGPAHLIGKFHDRGALVEILGISDRDLSPVFNSPYDYQHIGSVAAPQGRLVAFPNVLEHRVDPLRLVDETKPGRFRWLKLSLVDPHYRVCSTRNVPPQQHDWWAAAVGHELAAGAGLPEELIENILRYTDEWPMGMEEAAGHREQMIEEAEESKYDYYGCDYVALGY